MDRIDAVKRLAAEAGRGELTVPTKRRRHPEAAPLLAARTVAIANSLASPRPLFHRPG